jgi:hypothetical protein
MNRVSFFLLLVVFHSIFFFLITFKTIMGSGLSRETPTNGRKLKTFRSNSVSEAQLEKETIVKPSQRIINGREYHSTESSAYMLPKDDCEIDRLHDEHFITKELLGL